MKCPDFDFEYQLVTEDKITVTVTESDGAPLIGITTPLSDETQNLLAVVVVEFGKIETEANRRWLDMRADLHFEEPEGWMGEGA